MKRETIIYDLSERAAKEEHVRKYKALVDRQKADGTLESAIMRRDVAP